MNVVKLCPYLHVPIQSGDDQVLQRMKRHYTQATFAAFVERVVRRCRMLPGDGCHGRIPGEDEAAFRNTRTLLADLPLAYLHVFSYSSDRTPMRSAIRHRTTSRGAGAQPHLARTQRAQEGDILPTVHWPYGTRVV